MKKLLTLILALIVSPLFAKCIIIDKRVKSDATLEYTVRYYGFNADGSKKEVIYKSIDDVSKVLPVISKTASGLSKDSDQTIIYINDDDTIDRIDYAVKPTAKSEAKQQVVMKGEDLPAKATTDVVALTAEVAVKPELPQATPK